ncbi:Peptidyl-tRNA hydrolase ICT1, mitochondrial OS=Salmo salar GN=ict1 PE=2 SV=1 [Rhizoctonia solani AG-1 IB]|uniref:Peptidyl-tRNA hydrolase ICT1, mitochondrial n=1 Tax=Thanatephorus cucumeris (strain AG1-IB / isolate 7/3/14) TaxID=1108050 RepID=A0A0B7G3B9_THACB|nr:Peptidyl-tRNA hydrolase ICT1, mitochondrial OS=Salmo salar GN=ict1 PE=2 SV=1 [Rhizoctonia solani AG-1 IB]
MSLIPRSPRALSKSLLPNFHGRIQRYIGYEIFSHATAPMVKGTLELSARSKLVNPRHIHTSALCREETQIYQWVAHSDGSHDEGAPLPPNIASFMDKSEDTKELARSWVKQFTDRGGIPKREFEVGYSRSSGPGGQHVNKTSTKATVRLPLNCRWVPEWAKSDLRKHATSYIARNDSLQVSSDVNRSQSQNLAECLRKINSQIESAASTAIPKPPDLEKLKRIGKYKASFERAQKETKQRSKSIKQGRGKVRPE